MVFHIEALCDWMWQWAVCMCVFQVNHGSCYSYCIVLYALEHMAFRYVPDESRSCWLNVNFTTFWYHWNLSNSTSIENERQAKVVTKRQWFYLTITTSRAPFKGWLDHYKPFEKQPTWTIQCPLMYARWIQLQQPTIWSIIHLVGHSNLCCHQCKRFTMACND